MNLLSIYVIACFAGQITWAQISPPRCTLQNGGDGGCVPRDQCNPATNTMYDDGSGIFNTRSNSDPIVCPSTQVCCAFGGTVEASSPLRSRIGCDVEPSTPQTCGVQKRQQVPGFVKTRLNEADPGEFPWSINLMIQLPADGNCGTQCGKFHYVGTGSLIHTRVVLTAAHVLHNKDLSNLKAIVGDHDQQKKVLRKRPVNVTEVVMHNNFNSGNGDYNFALVFLTCWPTSRFRHVGTVCLPPPNYVPPAGTRCVFSGWGVDSSNLPQVQLTKTEVPIVSHPACQQKLQQNPMLGPGFSLLASFLCAGGEVGKDICGGAGGSVLVCPIEGQQGRYVQTGIVSWLTNGCGVNGDPTVFADVAVARPWIDQQLADRGFPTTSYIY